MLSQVFVVVVVVVFAVLNSTEFNLLREATNPFCIKSLPSTEGAVVLSSPNHFRGHLLVWYTSRGQLSMTSEVSCKNSCRHAQLVLRPLVHFLSNCQLI